MRHLQTAVIIALAASFAGCSNKPSLVGTWKAVGPLNETITLKLKADGGYESSISARTPTGKLLTNFRTGTYQLDGDRLFQTQFENHTMAGNHSKESIDLPATTVRWMADDKFRAIDATGTLTFWRDKSPSGSLTLRS